jgi:hypothetical protein
MAQIGLYCFAQDDITGYNQEKEIEETERPQNTRELHARNDPATLRRIRQKKGRCEPSCHGIHSQPPKGVVAPI